MLHVAVDDFCEYAILIADIFNFVFKVEFLNTSTSDPSPSNLCALIQFNENMWANGSHPEDEFPTMISVISS